MALIDSFLSVKIHGKIKLFSCFTQSLSLVCSKSFCMLCSLSSWSEFTLCLYLLFALSISQLELLREPSVMWCYQEGMILQNVCYIYDDIFNIFIVFRAIHNMNTWYPDATPEELENTDNVCIICREEMQAPSTKKLPCNHIFHKNCLRSWFQRQQTCPTCRLDVLRCFRTL